MIADSKHPSLPLLCPCGSSYRLILIAGIIRCHDCRTRDKARPSAYPAAAAFAQAYEFEPLNERDNGGWFGYRR